MANINFTPSSYKKAEVALVNTAAFLTENTLKISILGAGYTADLTATGHEFFTDLSDVLVTADLVNPTVSASGLFDADTTSVVDPGSGVGTQIVIWGDTGTPATSRVFFHATLASSITFDGNNDSVLSPSGIFQFGS